MYHPNRVLYNAFLDYIRFEKRFSQHTILAYETDLSQFFCYLEENQHHTAPSQITTSVVRNWIVQLRADGLTGKTLNRKISTLKSYFKHLLRTGQVQQSPLDNFLRPKISKRLPSFVTEQNIADLLSDIRFPDSFEGRTEQLILSFFYNTGLRVSELTQLETAAIDFYYAQLKVLGKGNKERLVPLSPNMLAQLKDYCAEKARLFASSTSRLFVNTQGKPVYTKQVYLVVHKYLSQVTTLPSASPHLLRHSFATHLMNSGADLNAVKNLLGHASLASTQVYTHNTIEKLKAAHKQAHPKG